MSAVIQNYISKTAIVGFMDFFSRIQVERLGSAYTSAGDAVYVPRKVIPVPVQWASKEKWFEIYYSSSARKAMDPEIADKQSVELQWILPRISVYLNGIMYDPARRLTKTQQVPDFPGDTVLNRTRQYTPAPWNLDIDVSVISKTLDDNLQIMEQIIPYFAPEMSINVNIIPGGDSQSIPIVLNGVITDIPMDIGENDERFIIFSYNFSLKTNFYPRKKYQSNLLEMAGWNYAVTSHILNAPVSADPTKLALLIPGTPVFGPGIGPNTVIVSNDGSGHITINTLTTLAVEYATLSFGVNRTILHTISNLELGNRYVQITQDWLEHLQKIEEKFSEYEATANSPNPFV